MILTRTPFRVSLFGGSSDYPAWYRKNYGAVLSGSINKYCWLGVRYLPPYFEHKHRIVYGRVEEVKDINDINHPSVRECLKFAGIEDGVEIHHDGDVPARSGLGTSSSFTVGLLNALYALQGRFVTKMALALDAIHVEQDLIKEAVGSQDQLASSFGGFNKISLSNSDIKVEPVKPNPKIEESLLLVYNGLPRYADSVAASYKFDKSVVETMRDMVDEAIPIIEKGDVRELGRMLNESWELKCRLSQKITTPYIQTICEMAQKAGAVGQKICGAGGGGFILLVVEPDAQESVKKALDGFLFVPFQFEQEGSMVVFDSEVRQ